MCVFYKTNYICVYIYVVCSLGDMLFYESSKCFHGRPIPFEGGEGAYYTSVFSHYYPEGWVVSYALHIIYIIIIYLNFSYF